MTEQRYLQFGVIWREFGARDRQASCRKMDQFIFFEDIHEFTTALCNNWQISAPDFDEVINWRIPLMTLTPGMNVHRMDMTLACMQESVLSSPECT